MICGVICFLSLHKPEFDPFSYFLSYRICLSLELDISFFFELRQVHSSYVQIYLEMCIHVEHPSARHSMTFPNNV